MSTSPPDHHPSPFPTVPESLSTGGHGMRDYYAEQEHTAQRTAPHTLQDLTPYLGLRARLSQVWLNRWTILILLVLARVLIAIGDLRHDIDSAKTQALSACSSVEAMGSTMASMPFYLSTGTNELAATGVEKAVNGLHEMLLMSITGVEEIFVFVVNMMYGTYECLITVTVSSAAHAGLSTAQDAAAALNQTLSDFNKTIQQDAADFTNELNSFMASFNNLGGIAGVSSSSPPALNLDGPLNSLSSFKLPTNITDELTKLNGSIPSFAQVRNATNTVLELPFESLKNLVNQSLGTYTFDRSVFPTPARQELTFCSDNDGIDVFFDGLYDVADIARKVFIAVLVLAAVIACIPSAILELRKWRTMQQRAAIVGQPGFDSMDVVYIVSRPHTAGMGLKASQHFATTRKQVLTRWFVAYVTSVPALLVLAIALAGLFSALCQYILLKAIEKEVPSLVNTVGAFTDKVVAALDSSSAEWANGTNAAILAENSKINNDILGWVSTSTTTLNDTLSSFINETTSLINQTFGGTVLFEPISGLFECLIGLKVASIEQGLTWVHDNAQVDFPTFPNDTFSAGAQAAVASTDPTTGQGNNSFVADPGSDATDKITATVVSLCQALEDGVRTEALIATGVLCCYFAVVLIGAARVAWVLARRPRIRAEGGATTVGDIDAASAIIHGQPPPPLYVHSTGSSLPQQQTGRTGIDTDAYAAGKFSAFRGPMPGAQAPQQEQQPHQPQQYPSDEKFEFAEEHAPAGQHNGRDGTSVYGVIDEKANRF